MSESLAPITPAQFRAMLDELESDITTYLHGFVHGDESTTVPLGGASTDSLRRMVAKIKADQGDLLGQMQALVAQAQAAAGEADAAVVQVEALIAQISDIATIADEVIAAAEQAIQYGQLAEDSASQARNRSLEAQSAAEQAEASANEASESADKILELGVSATGLAYTSSPTVAYDAARALMTFGIPQGAPGVQGPPGPAPVTGIIDGGGAAETQMGVIDGGWVEA